MLLRADQLCQVLAVALSLEKPGVYKTLSCKVLLTAYMDLTCRRAVVSAACVPCCPVSVKVHMLSWIGLQHCCVGHDLRLCWDACRDTRCALQGAHYQDIIVLPSHI
jgi:hypothetical protein